MEDRIFIVGRSKSRLLDVARALAPVGGGGHSQASSAIVKGKSLEETKKIITDNLPSILEEPLRARDIMSHPVYFVDTDMSIGDALIYCQRYGHSGICVKEGEMLAGIVSRKDLDKAVAHRLERAPVKGIMSRGVRTVDEDTTVHELRRLMATSAVGRLPVVAAGKAGDGKVKVAEVTGIVTRTDVLRTLHPAVKEGFGLSITKERDLRQRLLSMRSLVPLFEAAQTLSSGYRGVYLVGGFVRDMIIGEANYDVDIAVEGNGIEFAERLAEELDGRMRAHRKFNTAVVMLDTVKPGLRVDVATTRTEFYDYPAALPTVEHSSIKRDLYRRDFTINAMAVSLAAHDFGRLLDFFGGLEDIDRGIIRVLHNLSFIEDPTRLFRAIRYENRFGFRMNPYTLGLARGCVDMDLVGDLSSARLRDELVWLFSEPEVEFTIMRIGELDLGPAIHPALSVGREAASLVGRADGAARKFKLMDDIKLWRLRLACLARRMDAGQLRFWTQRLKLRRTDADIVTESVVLADKVQARLASAGLSRPELHELLERLPAEAHLLAYAASESERARKALELYLTELRFVEISISGADLLEMGIKESPQVGELLKRLRMLKLDGKIDGRKEELDAARKLIDKAGAAGRGGR
jgi:tRNA nucleotidyltransferase (CCA-adding enzyme)